MADYAGGQRIIIIGGRFLCSSGAINHETEQVTTSRDRCPILDFRPSFDVIRPAPLFISFHNVPFQYSSLLPILVWLYLRVRGSSSKLKHTTTEVCICILRYVYVCTVVVRTHIIISSAEPHLKWIVPQDGVLRIDCHHNGVFYTVVSLRMSPKTTPTLSILSPRRS